MRETHAGLDLVKARWTEQYWLESEWKHLLNQRLLDLVNKLTDGRMCCAYEKISDGQAGTNSFLIFSSVNYNVICYATHLLSTWGLFKHLFKYYLNIYIWVDQKESQWTHSAQHQQPTTQILSGFPHSLDEKEESTSFHKRKIGLKPNFNKPDTVLTASSWWLTQSDCYLTLSNTDRTLRSNGPLSHSDIFRQVYDQQRKATIFEPQQKISSSVWYGQKSYDWQQPWSLWLYFSVSMPLVWLHQLFSIPIQHTLTLKPRHVFFSFILYLN